VANRLYRWESQYTLGDATAQEGFWFVVDARAHTSDVATSINDVVSGWYTEPHPDTGVSRADLSPQPVLFTRNRILAFALDFLQLESELIDAVFSIPATSDREPLPAIVSKEIEIHGANGGRGGFNRVHTSFHPVDAVEVTDARFCTAQYQTDLVNAYSFLFDLINQTPFGVDAIPDPVIVFASVARVRTPRGPSNNILRYEAEPAVRVGSHSTRWGTMRRRGAVVLH